jgi:mannose-6-phosphate isomerase
MERFGTRLLVKLLAAGQRLPVHAHPRVSFAAEHLGKAHGKAEARYIVEGGEVYLGLKQDVAGDDLKSLVISQDVDTRLSMLHRVEVHPSDVVYVPLGVLHAINECVPGRAARAGGAGHPVGVARLRFGRRM